MRIILCLLIFTLISPLAMTGEKKKDQAKGSSAVKSPATIPQAPAVPQTIRDSRQHGNDNDFNRDRDHDDPWDNNGNDHPDKGKGKDKNKGKDVIVDGRRIPPGIEKQGDAKIEKWLGSKGQLKQDLDTVYDRDPRKRGDKDIRQSRADALFDALANMGMEPDEARRLLRGMAESKDKDDAYETVRKVLDDSTVAGIPASEAVGHVGKVVDAANSAAEISDALGKWMRKR